MRKQIEFLYNSSVIRFGSVGASSTLIDLIFYNIFLSWGINIYLATAAAFMIAFVNGYYWNSRYVFKSKRNLTESGKYLIVTALGLGYTEGIIHLLHVRWAIVGPILAKLVAVVVVFFWNYLMSKKWAFK